MAYYVPYEIAEFAAASAPVPATPTTPGQCHDCGYQLIKGWCSSCDMAQYVQDRDREDTDMREWRRVKGNEDVMGEGEDA